MHVPVPVCLTEFLESIFADITKLYFGLSDASQHSDYPHHLHGLFITVDCGEVKTEGIYSRKNSS